MKTTHSRNISPLNGQTVFWNDTTFSVRTSARGVVLTKRFDPARDIVYLSCAGYWPELRLLCPRDHRVYRLETCFIRIASDNQELSLLVDSRAVEVI